MPCALLATPAQAGVRMRQITSALTLIYPPSAHDYEYYKVGGYVLCTASICFMPLFWTCSRPIVPIFVVLLAPQCN